MNSCLVVSDALHPAVRNKVEFKKGCARITYARPSSNSFLYILQARQYENPFLSAVRSAGCRLCCLGVRERINTAVESTEFNTCGVKFLLSWCESSQYFTSALGFPGTPSSSCFCLPRCRPALRSRRSYSVRSYDSGTQCLMFFCWRQ